MQPVREHTSGEVVMTALGSEVRREILQLLTARQMAAGDIAAQFPISRPAISKHLKLLSEAGLICHEQVGTSNIYRLDQTGFSAGHDWLNRFWPDALQRFRMVAENTYEAGRDE